VLATYYVENAVALIDMHGFVIRDREWNCPWIPVLGFMTFDPGQLSGDFELILPARPQGEYNDVDHDGDEDQEADHAAGYSPNLYGGPFSEGDDRSRGWPNYPPPSDGYRERRRSDRGKLIIWSGDDVQEFLRFGDDGLLFTDDDLVWPAGRLYHCRPG
jgi:hypothetical protein